ncbi:hypothetical protein K437DRAFT_3151 [Tilletiaria anomala UBC 951]|uniref:Uncharacterized protein n=1 Tax=Tilletiaria anomala (strain ATCC 24038 / CBS 436.72 / UBC 951) TaxID=1037660 RepID=A0A066WLX3_TILAU|nr:uncharacterized protein K437DRAFT_3151 [Tilletiaria anomala UBC 951]KDN53598.1 hypothetical protein K437DRAFT_3151 [Tilletiaria anomala UBC 951]
MQPCTWPGQGAASQPAHQQLWAKVCKREPSRVTMLRLTGIYAPVSSCHCRTSTHVPMTAQSKWNPCLHSGALCALRLASGVRAADTATTHERVETRDQFPHARSPASGMCGVPLAGDAACLIGDVSGHRLDIFQLWNKLKEKLRSMHSGLHSASCAAVARHVGSKYTHIARTQHGPIDTDTMHRDDRADPAWYISNVSREPSRVMPLCARHRIRWGFCWLSMSPCNFRFRLQARSAQRLAALLLTSRPAFRPARLFGFYRTTLRRRHLAK